MLCTKCNTEKKLKYFHKDKQKEGWYSRVCKECRKKESATHYKQNSERILKRNKKWYRENTDKYNVRYKQYQHSEKYRLTRRVRTNRKKETADWSITFDSLHKLKLRQKKCNICWIKLDWEKKRSVHLDHIIPLSREWKHILSNVQRLCATCNRRKNCY